MVYRFRINTSIYIHAFIYANNFLVLSSQAAAGWPTSEILDRPIAEYFNVPSALDDMDRVPFWGNGNLDQIRPEFWGFCLGLSAAIDSYQNQRSRTQKDYTPGDLGWDPLNLASSTTESSRKSELQLAEMQNGRLAMLGVTGFAVQEFVVSQGVVDETPIFFQPLTETAENILKGILE
jgi:Chlorophyll A-B binding protein